LPVPPGTTKPISEFKAGEASHVSGVFTIEPTHLDSKWSSGRYVSFALHALHDPFRTDSFIPDRLYGFINVSINQARSHNPLLCNFVMLRAIEETAGGFLADARKCETGVQRIANGFQV
jgi:hypothetical protein